MVYTIAFIILLLIINLIVLRKPNIGCILAMIIFYEAINWGISYAQDVITIKQIRQQCQSPIAFEQQLQQHHIAYTRDNLTFKFNIFYEVQY